MREKCINLIKEAIASNCRCAIACNDIGINLKTFKRWKTSVVDKRAGPCTEPANKLSQEERAEVISVSISQEYADLSPSIIVPLLADKNKYVASESSFYRILKEDKLLTHRGKSNAAKNNRPSPLIANGPNQIYSWDITYLRAPILGMFFYLYMFMDIFSRKIVGYEVHETESMESSSRLIDKICITENIKKEQLVLHSDNGGAMKGATMLATLYKLGVIPSFSRPRVSDDNPYSESLFKTLKYCPEYPNGPFESIEHARTWCDQFVNWYNNKHLHSGIKFVTPNDRHNGNEDAILRRRKIVYETARLQNPNRWSKSTRNWNKIKMVYLNYLQGEQELSIKIAS